MDSLDFELLKRMFGNLGAVQGNGFGKTGIINDANLIDKTITFEGVDDKCLIWAGKASKECSVILTNVGTENSPEFIAVMELPEANIGLCLEYFDKHGEFLSYEKDKWVQVSTMFKLNLAAAVEMITQEGLLWEPISSYTKLHGLLLSAVESFCN